MRTKEIQAYEFAELDEITKANVVEKHREINVNYYGWNDYIDEDFANILQILGYSDIKTYYSGFWSQGDGASFIAKWSYEKQSVNKIAEYAPKDTELHRIARRLQEISKHNLYQLNARLTNRGHYCHEYTMLIDYIERNNGYKIAEDTDTQFLELSRDLARWYYKRLQEDYEYLTTDEAVIETILANEYEFDKQGEII